MTTTPTQEVIELIRPRLEAAINARGLGWLKRNAALEIAPHIALWELEILLSLISPTHTVAITAIVERALPYLAPAAVAFGQLLLRLLSQPRSTFSTEVQMSAPTFAPQVLL